MAQCCRQGVHCRILPPPRCGRLSAAFSNSAVPVLAPDIADMRSGSADLRRRGNERYGLALQMPSGTTRLSNLSVASELYAQALAAATTDAEKASACKNAGAASAAAANDASCPPDRKLRFACTAASQYTHAVEHGQACMAPEWLELCTSSANAASARVMDQVSADTADSLQASLRILDQLRGALDATTANVSCSIAACLARTHSSRHRVSLRAQLLFNIAVAALLPGGMLLPDWCSSTCTACTPCKSLKIDLPASCLPASAT